MTFQQSGLLFVLLFLTLIQLTCVFLIASNFITFFRLTMWGRNVEDPLRSYSENPSAIRAGCIRLSSSSSVCSTVTDCCSVGAFLDVQFL